MNAVFVSRYGGPDVLVIRQAPIPRPKPDEVLVRVKAIGLNFADIVGRWGVYPGTPKPPFIPGIEFSGDVVAVGLNVRSFVGHERVMGYSRLGSHAEYVAVSEKFATAIPDSMTYGEGASFLVTGMTALHGLLRLANIRRGENLLVHAAAGGVGTATVQLASHCGATIFATVGTEKKLTVARDQGAHYLINYHTHDFSKWIRDLTKGYGVDVVMDSVGGRVFQKSWSLLAPMGRYILFGISSLSGTGRLNPFRVARAFAAMRPVFPPSLLSSNKGIFGFNLGTLEGKEEYFKEAAEELLRLHGKGVLKPVIGQVFRFHEIIQAHRALQSGQTIGKVVVTLEQDS